MKKNIVSIGMVVIGLTIAKTIDYFLGISFDGVGTVAQSIHVSIYVLLGMFLHETYNRFR